MEKKNGNGSNCTCSTCHESYVPVGGWGQFCLRSEGVRAIGKERIPATTRFMRDQPNMCGPQGRWWTPIVEVPAGHVVAPGEVVPITATRGPKPPRKVDYTNRPRALGAPVGYLGRASRRKYEEPR